MCVLKKNSAVKVKLPSQKDKTKTKNKLASMYFMRCYGREGERETSCRQIAEPVTPTQRANASHLTPISHSSHPDNTCTDSSYGNSAH